MSAGAYVKSFAAQLEQRLVNSSLELEDAHLEAAIDAQLSSVRLNQTNSNPIVVADYHSKSESAKQTAIFDDYVNPDSVENCLSPFVPSHSARIDAMVKICKLGRDDVLLDIGCGDGRVCLATVATTGEQHKRCSFFVHFLFRTLYL